MRDAVKVTKRLMMSGEESIRLQAIGLFIQLSELEIALVEALKESPEAQAGEERNPLARRARITW